MIWWSVLSAQRTILTACDALTPKDLLDSRSAGPYRLTASHCLGASTGRAASRAGLSSRLRACKHAHAVQHASPLYRSCVECMRVSAIKLGEAGGNAIVHTISGAKHALVMTIQLRITAR